MNAKAASLLIFSALFASAFATCSNPSVSATSFTTQDATVLTNIAYISQFKLSCDRQASDIALYAEVQGKPVAVVRLADNNYQVSWTEEVKKAASGNFEVKIFDDEGYAALRKAQRSGEDTSAVKPLTTLTLNHPGAYQGPWINSEAAAAIAAIGVFYYAFAAKSKLAA